MTRVLIITGQHFATQPRRVDLHFTAEALNRRGIPVDFLSVRLSRVSRLVNDERWKFAKTRVLNRWTTVHELQDEFIWHALMHPLNFGRSLLDRIAAPFYRLHGKFIPRAVKKRLSVYSDIMIESGIGLLLLPQIRRRAPQARIIYHAADRLETIRVHPLAQHILRTRYNDLDFARLVADSIRSDIPAGLPIMVLPHGLAKDVFDRVAESPYRTGRNAVSVGDMLFDAHAVETMARAFPDWTFHLFGCLGRLDQALQNVTIHGERPFAEIVPYIRFADIGLAPYLDRRDADYISQSSMKMIQYTYARLPIVAPTFAAAGRGHVLGYDPSDDDSIRTAFERATRFNVSEIDTSAILTWDEMTAKLFPVVTARGSSSDAPASTGETDS